MILMDFGTKKQLIFETKKKKKNLRAQVFGAWWAFWLSF
jgi:hypothetical protein